MKSLRLALAAFFSLALGSIALGEGVSWVQVGQDAQGRKVFLDTETISSKGFNLFTPLSSKRIEKMNVSMSCVEATVQVRRVSILADGANPTVVQKKPGDVIRDHRDPILERSMAIACKKLRVSGY